MKSYVKNIVKKAKEASCSLANLNPSLKNSTLLRMADYLIAHKDFILKENKKDVSSALKNKLGKSFIDRLVLNEKRLEEMSLSLREVAGLADPINRIIDSRQRPNGLLVQKVRVSIGVVLVIYEARPNVTSDCAGLLFKSSNIGILRGGKYSINSNTAIGKVLQKAAKDSGLDFEPFFVIERTSHDVVSKLLKESKYIDLVIPRGGESLIKKVVQNSQIPVIKHYKGVCHIYVDSHADLSKALKICVNSKVQKPSVCNAVETILVHKDISRKFLPRLKKEFINRKVEIRGDAETAKLLKGIKQAGQKDWKSEYLDLIVSIKVVEDIKEAVSHINHYGSHHTDGIITDNVDSADKFVKEVDSACCFVNISTRFSDGCQFGLGAEIGISTDKLHARGPMGLEELTTYKWVVRGNGQIRE